MGTPGCFGASAGAGGALSLGVRRAPSLSPPSLAGASGMIFGFAASRASSVFRSSARVSCLRPFVFHIPRRRLASPLAHSALLLSETRAAFRDTCRFPRHVPLSETRAAFRDTCRFPRHVPLSETRAPFRDTCRFPRHVPLSETRAAFRDTCPFPRHVPLSETRAAFRDTCRSSGAPNVYRRRPETIKTDPLSTGSW